MPKRQTNVLDIGTRLGIGAAYKTLILELNGVVVSYDDDDSTLHAEWTKSAKKFDTSLSASFDRSRGEGAEQQCRNILDTAGENFVLADRGIDNPSASDRSDAQRTWQSMLLSGSSGTGRIENVSGSIVDNR